MRKLNIILTVTCVLFVSTIFAQQYAVDLIPRELKSRANAIIRDEQVVLDMKNEANISQTITKAITILNSSGDRYAQLLLFYDKSKSIKDLKGHIYDEFGTPISKFSIKDFRDYSATDQVSMFDDIRVKHFSPNVNTYPYTIVYTYELKHNQNLFIPYWRPNNASDIAVEKSTYTFTCKPDLTLRIKEQNIQNPPKVEKFDKFKTYTWSVSTINAKKEEPYSPIEDRDAITVKIVPETFQYFKKKGTVNDWASLGKWFYEDLLKDKQDLPQATKDKVKLLTANASTPKEKAKILYEYMQNKTRYISIQIGIGGLEPFPASYVDRLGYGDCKALVNYMQALLSAADIKSLYCIVEAGNRKVSLDESFANAVDGNHIILCIPFEKDSIWLECTSNKHPFGYLGDFTDDRLVLACGPDGGEILKTPATTTEVNTQIRKAVVHVNKAGNVNGTVQTLFAGSQFDNHYPNMFRSANDQMKELKSYYDVDNITFNTVDYKITNPLLPELSEDLAIDIKSYVVKNGDKLILQPNIFNITRAIPESKNRNNEVYINRGYTDIDEIEYTFDSAFVGPIIPLEKIFDCPMGKYELRIFQDGKKLKIKRYIHIVQGNYAADSYQKFYNFMKEISVADRVKYTINLASK